MNNAAHNTAPQDAPALPAQPDNAVQHLCRLSQTLLDLAERESQALVQKDMLAFSVLQDEKEALSHTYLGASKEFRARLNEFRRVNQPALKRLESIQNTLGERTQDNNVLIEQMKNQAERKTHDSLLVAQEYATSERANLTTFPDVDDAAQTETGA